MILDLVVKPDGEPTDTRVVQTLDAGLDGEAVKAVRQWKLAPGRLNGTPASVRVTVILDFTMR